MDTPELSLVHLIRMPDQPSEDPPLLLLLHGVGSNEYDLFGLAEYLDPRFIVISTRAPINRAPGSYAWFNVTFTPDGPLIDPVQAEESRRRLVQFIDETVAEYGADPDRVYLMGFSQGAIMSASVALTQPESVAGAVLMSGRILPEIRPLMASSQRLQGLPFLVVHGTTDTVLPIQHGRSSRTLLGSLPVRMEYREYPMAHEVSQQSLADIAAWLTQRLDAPPDV